jgi:hypothetical protein
VVEAAGAGEEVERAIADAGLLFRAAVEAVEEQALVAEAVGGVAVDVAAADRTRAR